jgi:hypothetical protein
MCYLFGRKLKMEIFFQMVTLSTCSDIVFKKILCFVILYFSFFWPFLSSMVTKPHLIIFLSVTNAPTDIEGSSSTTTTTTTVEPPIEAELGSGEVPEVEGRLIPSQCRADDVVQCTDGSRVICADQICDGIKDCEDGADEQNCPTHGSQTPRN